MIIDFHTHCFPQKIVAKAISQLSATGNIKSLTDGTADGLVSMMDACGIDRSAVCNIATNPHQQTSVNDFAIALLQTHPRLIPLGSVNPDCDEATVSAELRRLKEAGIAGIKIHPDYMKHAIDEPCFDKIFRACCTLDLFVVTHAGWDFISPDNTAAPPARIRRVIDRYPALRLVAAHFGGNRMWEEVCRELVGQHVWFDTALGCAGGIGAETATRIIKNHDLRKILLGSDCPWSSPRAEYDFIMHLPIPAEEKENITCRNAQALLGIR